MMYVGEILTILGCGRMQVSIVEILQYTWKLSASLPWLGSTQYIPEVQHVQRKSMLKECAILLLELLNIGITNTAMKY